MGRLEELDEVLLDAVIRAQVDERERAAIRAEAEAELRPFRSRLTPGDYERSLVACVKRLVRERYRVPVLKL